METCVWVIGFVVVIYFIFQFTGRAKTQQSEKVDCGSFLSEIEEIPSESDDDVEVTKEFVREILESGDIKFRAQDEDYICDLLVRVYRGMDFREAEREASDRIWDGFEWPDFDKWKEKFQHDDQWPYMWSDYLGKLHCADRKLFSGKAWITYILSNKLKAFSVALATDLGVSTKGTKAEIIERVAQKNSDPTAREIIDAVVETQAEEEQAALTDKKLGIFIHTMDMHLSALRKLSRYAKYGTGSYSVLPADDCPYCSKYEGIIYKIGQNSEVPPFHPGCRCCLIPEVDR